MENPSVYINDLLKGKHILFVGGIGGIGGTTAKLLLQMGVNLSLTTLPGNPYISEADVLLKKIIEETGSSAKFQIIEANITIEKDLKKQIEQAEV